MLKTIKVLIVSTDNKINIIPISTKISIKITIDGIIIFFKKKGISVLPILINPMSFFLDEKAGPDIGNFYKYCY